MATTQARTVHDNDRTSYLLYSRPTRMPEDVTFAKYNSSGQPYSNCAFSKSSISTSALRIHYGLFFFLTKKPLDVTETLYRPKDAH
jgi:hypothetical protein